MPSPTAHTPSDADLGGPIIIPVTLVTVPLSNNGAKTAAKPSVTCLITLSVSSFTLTAALLCVGTYIHWVLLFAWLLLFRKWITTGLIGTYIHRVLVIYGYLYSRVYSTFILGYTNSFYNCSQAQGLLQQTRKYKR